MRTLNLFAAGLFVFAFGSPAAHAEAKKGSPSEVVRYFILSGSGDDEGFFNGLPAEGIIKEGRLGTRVASATIDVCHWVSNSSSRKDRFVVPLKVAGNTLTGT